MTDTQACAYAAYEQYESFALIAQYTNTAQNGA